MRLVCVALAATLGSTVAVTACGDDPSPSPSPSSDAGAATKRIGPAGGTLSAFGVTIEVPPGALASEVEIGIKPVSDVKLPDGVSLLGTAYELSPSGTQFAKPLKLVLPLPAGATTKDAVLIHQPSGGAEWLPVGAPGDGASTVTGFVRSFSPVAAVKMLFAQAGCFAPTSCDLSCDYAALTCKGSCKSRGARIAAGASCELTPQGLIACTCDEGGTGLAPRYPGPFTIGFLEGLMKPQLLLFGIANHCGWPCDAPTSDGGVDGSAGDGGGGDGGGGACGAGGPKTPTVAYDLGGAGGNVTSVSGGRIYFTTGASPQTIASVATDGTGYVAHGTATSPVAARTVVASATHVYWTEGQFNQTGGKVRRYPLPAGPAEDFLTDLFSPWALWVDTEVFVSEFATSTGGGVRSAAAGPHAVLGTDTVRADATHVYFNEGAGTSAVHRLPRDLSGSRTTLVTGAEIGAAGESVRNFVVDDANLYVLGNNNNLSLRLRRRAKDGSGAVADVVPPQQYDGQGLTSDASCLYYCSSGKGPGQTNKVWGVSKTGTDQTPNVVVSDAVSCLGLASDATHLYWVHSGKIWKVAK